MLSAGEEISGGDIYRGLRRLVSSRLALDLSRRSPRSIEEIFAGQASLSNCKLACDYQRLLESEKEDGPTWSRLIDELTVAETYFFRDQGQMDLLAQELFPRLQRESHDRPLRIWSAGCSSGEEPYSLAILLDGQQPQNHHQVIGTDINRTVLQTARAGIYRERSLRSTPALVRHTYFTARRDAYELLPRIRERVNFWVENLARPGSNPRTGLDLVVCRNVLIYLKKDRITSILEQFVRSLRPGGFLLTGHGELQAISHPFLEVRCFSNSIVYQRTQPSNDQEASRDSSTYPRLAPGRPNLLELVKECLRSSELSRGRAVCQEAARERPLEVLPRLLEAHLARLQGRWSEARDLLDKALYLDPDHSQSLLEMALVVAQDGDLRKARKLRQVALTSSGYQDFPDTLAELEHRLGKYDG